jgi:hypothetical protein
VNATDAQRRAPVQLADGRTGYLLYWPIPSHQRREGARPRRGAAARVYLHTGAVINVPTNQVSPLT